MEKVRFEPNLLDQWCCCHPTFFFFRNFGWFKIAPWVLVRSISPHNLFQILTDKKIRQNSGKCFWRCFTCSSSWGSSCAWTSGCCSQVSSGCCSKSGLSCYPWFMEMRNEMITPSERFHLQRFAQQMVTNGMGWFIGFLVLQNVITWSLMAKLYMMDFLGL